LIFSIVGSFLGPTIFKVPLPQLWIVGLILCCSLIWTLYVSMDNAGPPPGLLTQEDTEHFPNSQQRDEDETEEIDWNAKCSSCHLGMECRGPINGRCQLNS
jgi:cytochrome c553